MTNALVAVNNVSLGGVYLSTNIDFTNLAAQPTWTKMATTGLANTLIKRAQFDQFDPYNKIYLQLDNDTCYCWNGSSWTQIMTLAAARTLASTPAGYMGYIFVDKVTAGTVYIPMSQDSTAVALLKSVDYGANWTVASSIGGLVTAVAYGQAAGQYIILSLGQVYRTIYFSTNGGSSWSDSNHWANSFGGGQIKQDPQRPDHCYYINAAADYDLVDRTSVGTTELFDNYALGASDHETMHWIDKNTAGHQKIIRCLNNEVHLFATTDNWATLVDSTPTLLETSSTSVYGSLHCAIENVTYGMIGRRTNTGGGVQIVQAFVGDNPASMTGIAGTNANTAPYTNAIPGAAGCYVANTGIYVGVGAGAAEAGIFVYADEEGDITDIPSYPNLGTPMFGDRGSFRDKDADNDGLTPPTALSKYHAQDIREDTPQRHNIWPVSNGNIEVSDGTKWVETTPATFGIHAAVTLAADADTLLGLTGQQLNLDTQNANTVFAGPTSGAAAYPAFRALVAADLAGIDLGSLVLPYVHEHAIDEDLSGLCDGSRTVFILANEYMPETTAIYLNGVRQLLVTDYTEDAGYDQVTMTTAPEVGDILTADYILAGVI